MAEVRIIATGVVLGGPGKVTAGPRDPVALDNPRGCPCCQGPAEGDVLIDPRGRVWHLPCVLRALERVTRAGEDRGPAFHYAWSWDA